ncbi:MAG: hypothetical protein IMZ46_02180 [Acidobacteria bacterium]|nr:hypothetical protein [Acidobacteriota bacterium]
MDVRDLDFWAHEARRSRLVQRREAYIAALLPDQETSTIRSVMDGIGEDLEAVDQDVDEIDRAETENARLIAEANKMIKDRNARRRAKRAAGIEPTKKRRLPKKGKVIR